MQDGRRPARRHDSRVIMNCIIKLNRRARPRWIIRCHTRRAAVQNADLAADNVRRFVALSLSWLSHACQPAVTLAPGSALQAVSSAILFTAGAGGTIVPRTSKFHFSNSFKIHVLWDMTRHFIRRLLAALSKAQLWALVASDDIYSCTLIPVYIT